METTTERQKGIGNLAPEKVRSDLNLEKWSIWQPSKSNEKFQEKIVRREIELPTGEKVTAEVEVGYTNKGTLTTEDQKTFYALLKMWEEKGRTNDPTYFSLRRIAKTLKKRWGTNVIDSTSQSMLRLRINPLIWKNSYHDSEKNETFEILDAFNILSDLKVVKRKTDGHITQEFGYFKFNDLILKNIFNNHSKPVFLDIVLSFKSEIAQLLYTHIDLVMYRRTHYERRTRELFFDDLVLTGKAYKNPSNRKQKINLAIKELQGVRLSSGFITSIKLERTKDDRDYKIVVDKGVQQQLSSVEGNEVLEITTEIQPEYIDITSAVPNQERGSQHAREAVVYFYKLFFNTTQPHPTTKAISQATALIANHGIELVQYIIEFAHREAEKTDYHPQTFGGILQYTTRALAAHEDNERRKHAQENQREKEREERREEQYMIFARDELDRIKSAMPPDELEAIRAQIHAELIEDGANPDTDFTLNTRVRIKLDQLLTAKADLLTYDQWKEQGSEIPTT